MATDTLPDVRPGPAQGDVELSSLEATIDARLHRIARHERAVAALREAAALGVPSLVLVLALLAAT